MPALIDGNYLNQFVAPQLLVELKNYKDDFLSQLMGAPAEALTADGIRFNKLINNVEFFVNNTADFTAQTMAGKKTLVEWEKYDTRPTKVTDAEIRYLNFDKRATVRVKHMEAMKMGIRDHVIWKLAPADDTNALMPVMRTTGSNDGNGRKRMQFVDVVQYLELVKKLNLPDMTALNMILCPEHETDLIIDRDSAKYFADKNIFFDAATGKVKSIMGFNFFSNNASVAYNSDGEKLAKGAALGAGDQKGSLFFYGKNTVYHIEAVKVLYSPESQDTKSPDPTSEFRLQTYGLVDRIEEYGVGAIVSDNA